MPKFTVRMYLMTPYYLELEAANAEEAALLGPDAIISGEGVADYPESIFLESYSVYDDEGEEVASND